MAEDSLQTLQMNPPDPATPTRVSLETTLKEGFFPMMPHSMYSLPLWPGITLVLITKVPLTHTHTYTHSHTLSLYTYPFAVFTHSHTHTLTNTHTHTHTHT